MSHVDPAAVGASAGGGTASVLNGEIGPPPGETSRETGASAGLDTR
ncbi:hypothetical protein [Planosporangium mesophilum]|nr:hypothetical protein [Planosporangium mesophilum]NJC85195.1 hypothetical protein [Planosporangium mesophilum]